MKKQLIAALLLVAFVCGCRLIPHVGNFSPMVCVALFAGSFFDRRLVYGLVFVAMMLSDFLLSVVCHYPLMGTWTLFTYSALGVIAYLGVRRSLLSQHTGLVFLGAIGANFGFWVWTNLGVWAFSGFYAISASGLAACFVAALPFLQHSTAAALLWVVVALGIKSIPRVSFQLSHNQR